MTQCYKKELNQAKMFLFCQKSKGTRSQRTQSNVMTEEKEE